MKSLHLTSVVLLLLCFQVKAEDRMNERVYIHTDKECYIAGENILLKFYVIDSRFQPSDLSKVGYVEICNTEKPLMQLKLALDERGGSGKIKIPRDIPTGMYQLSGYTRYMRNEGESVFFQKQIAIINAKQQMPDPKRFEIVEKQETNDSEEKESTNLGIKTNRDEYGNRQKVLLSIDNIPANTIDLIVSVSRNDSIALVPEINTREWLKQVSDTLPFSGQWIPEYEGHIITGRFVPDPREELLAGLAFVGDDIRYLNGRINPQNGTIHFYTAGIFGHQQIVTSATSPSYDKVPCRVDLLTPFDESLPADLPVLPVYPNEQALIDRYVGVQMQEKQDSELLNKGNDGLPSAYCTFQPAFSYVLDEYTRFPTISETILEFVRWVYVTKMNDDKRRISVFLNESQRVSSRTLVLLDGVPVYDHEDILNYNPMLIKRIDIYDERYLFGSKDFECIVSFITKDGALPHFQLSGESQLFNYECPALPSWMAVSDDSTDTVRNSETPDFRHTLYWNPLVEFTGGQPVHLSFYTSDLCGEFKVTVEGITSDGKMIRGVTYFFVCKNCLNQIRLM